MFRVNTEEVLKIDKLEKILIIIIIIQIRV